MMGWPFFQRYAALFSILAGALAAFAIAVRNIRSIIEAAQAFRSWLTNEKFEEPILLDLKVTPGLREDRPSLLDITVSYEGAETLFFYSIEIRHWPGWLLTTFPTGPLVSKARYNFRFSYNAHEKCVLDPPLVLNAASEPLLRFQVEIAPQGTFASSGGQVYAKLKYLTGRGRDGVLPLLDLSPDTYRDYPDIYAEILNKHQVDFFPVFEDPTFGKTETFSLTSSGAIKGKPLNRLQIERQRVNRQKSEAGKLQDKL